MPPDGTPAVIPQRYEDAVPLDRLVPHPMNPNQSDLGLLAELISANGYATPVLAQESTGLIVDGEHRVKAAQSQGMTTVPVVWLDIDDDTRDRLLASLNESTRRGLNDEAKLVALLQGLAATPRGLDGSAFDGDDLDGLINRLNPPPPDGFPEYGEDIDVEYQCPRCGYRGSGNWAVKDAGSPAPAAEDGEQPLCPPPADALGSRLPARLVSGRPPISRYTGCR